MRPKSMILIFIAMGCGLVASIGISQVIERRSGDGGTIKTGEVFVSLIDVPIRETLTAQMVQLEEWPLDKIPEGAITKIEEIEGMRPRQPLYQGEVMIKRKLIDPKDAMNAAADKIPDGYRVFPVKVDSGTISSGLVLPGDRVDVLVYLERNGVTGITQTRTQTILTDVTVFAVNELINRATDTENGSIAAKTVSLLVKPEQVERLMLGKELGKLSLSMRSTQDDSEVVTRGASVDDLNLSENAELSGSNTPSAEGQSSFMDFLNQAGNANSNTLVKAEPRVPVEDLHVMEIHTPEGVELFHWDDLEKLPRELREQESEDDFSDEPIDEGTDGTEPSDESSEETTEDEVGEPVPDDGF